MMLSLLPFFAALGAGLRPVAIEGDSGSTIAASLALDEHVDCDVQAAATSLEQTEQGNGEEFSPVDVVDAAEQEAVYWEREAMLHRDWTFLVVSLAFASAVQSMLSSLMEFGMTRHVLSFCVWLACAAVVDIDAWRHHGGEAAQMWFSGYVLEWMLSLDNLFIFHAIFKNFKAPAEDRDTALSLGILFAVVLRMVLFLGSVSIMGSSFLLQAVFGVLLICSGIHGLCHSDDKADAEAPTVTRALGSLLGDRLSKGYDKGSFFTRDSLGMAQVTMLGPVAFVVGVTDAVFAFDSVESKLGLMDDVFVAFSSTVVCMFALRSMFFMLEFLMDTFTYMKYGITLILFMIGTEMICKKFVEVPLEVMVSVMGVVFFASIAASFVFPPKKGEAQSEPLTDGDGAPPHAQQPVA